MVKIYGTATSRALRPLWLMEESGHPYELISVDFRKDENLDPEYLKLNPNGRVPAMQDGELVMFESMAINLYLARKYATDLYPKNVEDEALANMWSYWVMTEVEHSLLTVLLHSRVYSEEKRDPDKVARNIDALGKPFAVLNQALEKNGYLLGDTFSIADLNVAAVMSWCRPIRMDMSEWPELKTWLEACVKRPAFKRAVKK